jgi:Domain of unknown function (DUF4032)
MKDDHGLKEFRSFQQAAKEDFEQAYSKSFWRSILSWLRQNRNELLPFDEVLNRFPSKGQHYIGLKQVPIEQIVGSVSRYQDFDRAFLPKHIHIRTRWESVDRAWLQDVVLPPIELYKIGDIYFVKDGNHRVSVARENGQVFIDAYVIEIDVPVPLEPDMDLNDLILKQEEAAFLEHTHILDVRPKAQIELTLIGQYEKLAQHVGVHRWFMGEKLQRPISDEEAITGWYDEVYIPLVRIIRKLKILEKFPHRTEADLYLWIIEHRWYLREEYQRDVSLEAAAQDFMEHFSGGWLKRQWQQLKDRFAKK